MKLKRTHDCGQLTRANVGEEVILNGWVDSCRNHGGLIFLDLRDRYGITQCQIDPATTVGGEEFKTESVVAVRGTVQPRPEGNVNRKRATGEIELMALECELLGPTKTIPFEIVDDSDTREDLRLKYRYLDMRRAPLTRAMVFRSEVTRIIREVFHAERFVEVETPLLMKTTPEGARDYIVPSRLQPGKVYALPQSPQLFKQTLMVCGLDRYFQICKCLRDEDLRADRQPEFTQLDMEMSFVEPDDVFAVIEKTVTRLWKELLGKDLPATFPRLSYREVMDRYGIDKPDTRFGLELQDVSAIAASCGFQVFSGAVAAGGSVRAIVVPGGAELGRKKIDALEAVAKTYGAKGLAWVKINADGFQGPVGKFLTEDELRAMMAKAGANTGDLMLFVADRNPVVYASLAQVRLALGRELDLIDKSRTDVLWVTEFPLFEYDEEAGAWFAMHHMFTMPSTPLPDRPGAAMADIHGKLYDLVINGNEMGSGSVRIHLPEVQRKVFELVGMGQEEADMKFGWFLRALEYGAPPHGGIALGLDRLVMVMLGYDNIRDVIAFPKNASGVCPLTESPSEPLGDTLDVLGLQLNPDFFKKVETEG
ncbi:MAG: aspartate--tRNA ligase [Planctomycetes bacterium]|nr:aspartate--tRNA ligase [Planctomycetota bacterium]